MFNDVNNIINLIIEFCRDNVKVLMIGGIALIVIIIVVSILKGYDDDYEDYEDDSDADEKDKIVDEDTAAEPVQSIIEPSEQELTRESFPRETHPVGDIIGEIANLPTQGMKELEIKIPGAELKITYSGDCKEAYSQKTIYQEGLVILGDANSEGKDENLFSQEEPQEVISKEQGVDSEPYKGRTYIKFGPNNNNVSKSGKVYTEKELEEQIKD